MKLSFKAAAVKVLTEAEGPLSAQEIANIALEKGLIATEGATPDASMAAQLYVDLKKNPKTRFQKVGKGRFSLKTQQESAVSSELIVEKQNELVRSNLRKRLHEMDPYQFELLIGDLLRKLGYENVVVTKQSGDKGIDVIADLTLKGITNVKTVVQVKRYKVTNKIDGATVTQLRGSAEVDQRGLIITLSDFTKQAREESEAANKMPVSLVNGEKLIDLLMESEVGVKKQNLPLYSIDGEFFNPIEGGGGRPRNTGLKRGLWPLPGGIDKHVESLVLVLQAIEDGASTREKLTRWFLTAFDTVNSESTAAGYVTVPKTLGVVIVVDGKIQLTAAGRTFLESRDAGQLYEVVAKNVFGIVEMMEFIVSAQEIVTPDQMLEFFNDELDADWKSLHQVNFRLNWLVCLGRLAKVNGGYTLK